MNQNRQETKSKDPFAQTIGLRVANGELPLLTVQRHGWVTHPPGWYRRDAYYPVLLPQKWATNK